MRLTKGHLQLAILALLGGFGSWVIANYETLLPYRWETFRAANGEFSLKFPARAGVEDRQVSITGHGTATLHTVGTSTADGRYYALAYSDGPSISDKVPADSLDSARDNSIRNVQGSLIAEKQIMFDGHLGREIEARVRGGRFLDMRLILAKDRLYVLEVMSTNEQNRDSKNIQRFFDSFKLNGS